MQLNFSCFDYFQNHFFYPNPSLLFSKINMNILQNLMVVKVHGTGVILGENEHLWKGVFEDLHGKELWLFVCWKR